jgi:hypothetical protein
MSVDRSERCYAGRSDRGCGLGCIEFYSDTLGMPEFGCFTFKKKKDNGVNRREDGENISDRK